MSEKNKVALADLMKKQISEKSTKNIRARDGEPDDVVDQRLDKEEEEKRLLEKMKRESSAKAILFNNSEVTKRLVIENIIRYVAIICFLAVAVIGIIQFGTALLDFLIGLFHKLLMSSLEIH